MNKQDLITRLIIAEGELKDAINNENGCFDEIAQRIFMLALGCEDLLDESSEDVLIQLDKSVQITICNEQEYIDGIYLSGTITEVHSSTSSLDNSEIYVRNIEDIDRNVILQVIEKLINMCD